MKDAFGLGGLSRLSRADTRSISAENPTGEKGRGGMAEAEADGQRDVPEPHSCALRVGRWAVARLRQHRAHRTAGRRALP